MLLRKNFRPLFLIPPALIATLILAWATADLLDAGTEISWSELKARLKSNQPNTVRIEMRQGVRDLIGNSVLYARFKTENRFVIVHNRPRQEYINTLRQLPVTIWCIDDVTPQLLLLGVLLATPFLIFAIASAV